MSKDQKLWPKQFKLRTLIIVATLGPPLLALIWFCGIAIVQNYSWLLWITSEYSLLPGFWGMVAIGIYSTLAPPPIRTRSISLPLWQLVAMWGFELLTFWPWLWLFGIIFGWRMLCDDRGTPVSQVAVGTTSALVAVVLASIPIFRIAFGLASKTYLRIICFGSGVLIVLAAVCWTAQFREWRWFE